jgi:sugar phosphate isomerase/epimerase
MSLENVIGFAEWIVDDDARRAKGLDEAKRAMDLAAELGAPRLAAPPAGLSDKDHPDLNTIADRYRTLLELGDEHGVVPQLELWGFARALNKLSQVAYVAVETGHPRACILADSYHMYKGGSDYDSLRLISGGALGVFHINDYPATPDRKQITDAHRVFPGDGVAPLGRLFRALRDVGYRGMLSLEVFNREYWNQDALFVARSGLEKTRDAVRKALA